MWAWQASMACAPGGAAASSGACTLKLLESFAARHGMTLEPVAVERFEDLPAFQARKVRPRHRHEG